jgi:hypothetical protein
LPLLELLYISYTSQTHHPNFDLKVSLYFWKSLTKNLKNILVELHCCGPRKIQKIFHRLNHIYKSCRFIYLDCYIVCWIDFRFKSLMANGISRIIVNNFGSPFENYIYSKCSSKVRSSYAIRLIKHEML